jgi:acetoin utilization protein AcuB
MLVGERMSHPVLTISPDMSALDAQAFMRREHIRRAPVIHDGKLVGIVTESDLLNASPTQATLLSVWEINYLVSKIKARSSTWKTCLLPCVGVFKHFLLLSLLTRR